MTLKELENKVSISRAGGHGQYRITIEYRGREYSCLSNNTLAYDSLPSISNAGGCWDDTDLPMTRKQALQSFYDECKRENGLK